MARSARTALACVAALAAGAALAGCVTTQEKNARTLLTNARTLATESPVRITSEDPAVRVLRVSVIPGARADAVVVAVRSSAPRTITDLPISVGVERAHGGGLYLNGAANIDYYDTHIPLIPAGGTATWVLPSVARNRASAGRLFAVVGVPRAPSSSGARVLPAITAQIRNTVAGTLHVAVQNDSGVPQYGLQVYATEIRDGRYVGAARQTIAELDGGRRTVAELPLIGTDAHATVALYAPPTIFK